MRIVNYTFIFCVLGTFFLPSFLPAGHNKSQTFHNVIVLIPDGCGVAHMTIARWFKGTSLAQIKKEIEKTPYIINQTVVPHDAKVRELGTGVSRLEVMEELGFPNITLAPNISVDDGIEKTKSFLSRCWFDRERTATGFKALKRYRTQYNEERKVFNRKPLHDWTSDFADSFRYAAVSELESGFNTWGGDIEYGELGYA